MPRTLYAGPWAGEFGWELCWWNPIVRKKSIAFDRVIAEGPPASRYLYADFADEYIENPIAPHSSDGGRGRSASAPTPTHPEWIIMSPPRVWDEVGRHELRALAGPQDGFLRFEERKRWRCLAPSQPVKVADVMCAFRPVKIYKGRRHPEKEYPIEKCRRLVELILELGATVACYGGLENYYVEGTVDFRGRDLEETCGALAASRCAAGPSSGPIHLASLCRCPHVTWYGRSWNSYRRYERHWNPFRTRMEFIRTPLPEPDEIVTAVSRIGGFQAT